MDRREFAMRAEQEGAHMMDDVESENTRYMINSKRENTIRHFYAAQIDPVHGEDHQAAVQFIEDLTAGEADLIEPAMVTHSLYNPELSYSDIRGQDDLLTKKDMTEHVLKGMFVENTGNSFLDSGDHYGRNYENRQDNPSWFEGPFVTVDDDFTVTINTYQWLTEWNHLVYQPFLTEAFWNWGMKQDQHWLACMEQWAEENTCSPRSRFSGANANPHVINTYNYDTALDQTLQWIEYRGSAGGNWLILQVHGGCDVRGGYTAPRIFALGDPITPNLSVHADDGKNVWATHNGGYSWVCHDNSVKSQMIWSS